MSILVPIQTGRGLNDRMHWAKRAKHVKAERDGTRSLLSPVVKPQTPCRVLLTRVSPRGRLDDDNLPGALKAVRDAIADWLGVDDRHRDIVRYTYEQERGPWGVRIEFFPMPADSAEGD